MPEPQTIRSVFVGRLFHAPAVDDFRHVACAIVGVAASGRIAFVEEVRPGEAGAKAAALARLKAAWRFDDASVVELGVHQFLVPGLVDTHIHAPQYVFTGTGYDLTLLQWLEKYTFPREAAYGDTEYARETFGKVVRRTVRCGTTTACYYATTHLAATKALADVVHEVGQRAFVGKVNMDRNSPDYYVETTAESLASTRAIVDYIRTTLQSPLVTPVLTPRFVPSCTPELMRGLGDIAAEFDLPVQSHLSETPSEIEWVAALHPECTSYSDVYARYGLLTSRTIMAHCVHLSRAERDLLRERGVGISHCANSNFCLHSGALNVRRLLLEGHDKLGLGTDVAGGYSPSLLDAMRQSIIASKVVHVGSRERAAARSRAASATTSGSAVEHVINGHRHDNGHGSGNGHSNGKPNSAGNNGCLALFDEDADDTAIYAPLSFSEAFYLATLGGAKVLGLDKQIGTIEPGKDFDALVVDVAAVVGAASNIDVFPHDDPIAVFEKFIYLGDDRNIVDVYVQGRRITP
ncbi:hypothetical protein HK105_204518 [Polyrhizophydium stewartii]|uniref:Guanine deaminase n=1 Tax=Polyrhizophydium stewartii TaxID=2732419 RepID=A0ABR4N8G1_9FUNG|nr:hypothetical protein HK105_007468 [Polyrhizophydium stewartii]